MKYCSNCGKEVDENAFVCVNCGYKLMDQKEEGSALGILSIIFGALGGWLGLVFGIIGLCIYKTKENKRNCKIGIGLFVGWILLLIMIILMGSCVFWGINQ